METFNQNCIDEQKIKATATTKLENEKKKKN